MARDRQRAKQRKARRAHTERPEEQDTREPVDESRRPLHRENVTGPVEHTGEVDEFEASLVAGAGGEPAEPDTRDRESDRVGPPVEDPDAPEPAASGDPLVTRSDRIAGRDPDEADADAAGADADAAGADAAAIALGRPHPAEGEGRRGIGRFPGFLRASWGELQRVQWPDRRQVGQATAVVLGFVIIAGAFLGLADFLAEQLVDWII